MKPCGRGCAFHLDPELCCREHCVSLSCKCRLGVKTSRWSEPRGKNGRIETVCKVLRDRSGIIWQPFHAAMHGTGILDSTSHLCAVFGRLDVSVISPLCCSSSDPLASWRVSSFCDKAADPFCVPDEHANQSTVRGRLFAFLSWENSSPISTMWQATSTN